MVAAKAPPRKSVKPSADDDIDSYLEAQLVADITFAKTREVPKPAAAKTARKPVTKREEEEYDAIVDDFKLPDN